MTLVTGSHGTLLINDRGYPIETALDDDEYRAIQRFDVQEWAVYYGGLRLPDSVDILDLGYWTTDGQYEPPDLEWRLMFQKMRGQILLKS